MGYMRYMLLLKTKSDTSFDIKKYFFDTSINGKAQKSVPCLKHNGGNYMEYM